VGVIKFFDDMWLLQRLFKMIKQQHPSAQISERVITVPSNILYSNESTGVQVVYFSVFVCNEEVFFNLMADIPFFCSDVLPRENFERTVDKFILVNIYELQHVISEDTLTLFHVLKQEPFRRSITTRNCFNRFSELSMEALQSFLFLYNNPLYNHLWPNNTTTPEYVNKIKKKIEARFGL